MKRRFLPIITTIVLILFFSLFFLEKINLTTADLGRHIKNGEVFIRFGKVVSSNYYSYTEPDLPVITHHWLSGVIFYIVHSKVGFTGLSFFYALLSGVTVYVFYYLAKRKSDFFIALCCTLLLIPLIAVRKEIRPEGFSYLFLGIYTLLFELYLQKEIKFKSILLILFFLQILWVNLHIFFIMGIIISGAYLFVEILKYRFYKKTQNVKSLIIIFCALLFASLINPYGFAGLLEPLNIFKEYEYMIIENQSIFFMQKRIPQFSYFYVEMLSTLFIVVATFMTIHKKRLSYLAMVALCCLFMILSFRAIRGIPMFAMFLLPVLSTFIAEKSSTIKTPFKYLLFVLVLFTFIPGSATSFIKDGFGPGLIEGINKSANFVRENNIRGPVFNNYDIGGYMIYNFYNSIPVFVDNRPEAYSADFFKNVYGPAQSDTKYWNELDTKYNFNLIYFYRHDATQYAQPFLIERISDKNWIPIYVDNYVLILLKNIEENKDLIEKYKLPKEMFVITKT